MFDNSQTPWHAPRWRRSHDVAVPASTPQGNRLDPARSHTCYRLACRPRDRGWIGGERGRQSARVAARLRIGSDGGTDLGVSFAGGGGDPRDSQLDQPGECEADRLVDRRQTARSQQLRVDVAEPPRVQVRRQHASQRRPRIDRSCRDERRTHLFVLRAAHSFEAGGTESHRLDEQSKYPKERHSLAEAGCRYASRQRKHADGRLAFHRVDASVA